MKQIETQDPGVLASHQPYHIQAVRAHLMRRLTEKQYRRVALLYGFDGPPMSQREVAEAEGVGRIRVRKSVRQAVGYRTEVSVERQLVEAIASALQERWPEKDQEVVIGYVQLLRRRMRERWEPVRQETLVPGKLSNDAYLWLFWVGCKVFMGSDTEVLEERGAERLKLPRTTKSPAAPEALDSAPDKRRTSRKTGEQLPMYYPEERGVMHVDWNPEKRSGFAPRRGADSWESDRFTPRSPYDRAIDRLTDEFENGSITRVEYDRDMVVALARQQHPRLDDRDDVDQEFKQELEWAFGARELGAITNRECDRRVSAALRSYVGR